MRLNKKKFSAGQLVLHLIFITLCACYVLPLILLISLSFEGAPNVSFSLFPREFTTLAYETIFAAPQKIVQAYGVTFFYSITGVLLSLVVMCLFSYALSRRNFRLRGIMTFLVFFTTLFSGGLVPHYILNTALGLTNTIWIYILPGAISAWNVIVIRTYFQTLPPELFECGRLDGASELQICFRIAIPLSTPVLASVGFLRFVAAWNDWSTSQVYIRNPKLYSLQYLLQLILADLEMIEQMLDAGVNLVSQETLQNLETMRFAMAVVAAGPMLVVFPFFQKYFKKGMTLGSVKG